MKKFLRISVLVALVIFNTACGGGFVSVKIKVVDDTNVPIEDAQVAIYFSLSEGSNSYRGNTNRKGEASATR